MLFLVTNTCNPKSSDMTYYHCVLDFSTFDSATFSLVPFSHIVNYMLIVVATFLLISLQILLLAVVRIIIGSSEYKKWGEGLLHALQYQRINRSVTWIHLLSNLQLLNSVRKISCSKFNRKLAPHTLQERKQK